MSSPDNDLNAIRAAEAARRRAERAEYLKTPKGKMAREAAIGAFKAMLRIKPIDPKKDGPK